MKQTIYLSVLIFLISCQPHPKKLAVDPKIHYPDTTITAVTYSFDANTNDYRTATARRIVSLQERPIAIDSTADTKIFQKQSVLDTSYYVSVRKYVDTSGHLHDDSLPHTRSGYLYLPLPKEYLLTDYHLDLNPSTHH